MTVTALEVKLVRAINQAAQEESSSEHAKEILCRTNNDAINDMFKDKDIPEDMTVRQLVAVAKYILRAYDGFNIGNQS